MNRTHAVKRFGAEYWAVALLCGALAIGVRFNALHALSTAKTHYIQSSRAEAEAVAQRIEDALLSMYANLRTIALLPSVRAIDRTGSNLDPESRATIDQLYINIVNTVPVLELDIAPADLDPDRIDPATGRPDAATLVVGAAAPGVPARDADRSGRGNPADPPGQIRTEQLRRLRDQFAWLRHVVPTLDAVGGLNVPLLSAPELKAEDASAPRRAAADQSAVLFSVPFYGSDKALKGSISTMMPSSALRRLLPQKNYALLNPGYGYASLPSRTGQERFSVDYVGRGVPDPTLIYSDRIVLSLPDLHSNWALWVGRPDRDFTDGAEARSAWLFEWAGYGLVVGILLAGLAFTALLRRNADLTALAKARLEVQVAERTAEIRYMASHDPLTGAANRTLLGETMAAWLSERAPGESVALMCIDLDRFKAVNDSYGHPAGDALLKAVTDRIRACIGDGDLLARLGGDEFVVLHRAAAGPDDTETLARSIVEAVDSDFDLGAFTVRVGASVGVALAPRDGTGPDDLLARADLALYRAKHDGRGRCRFFETGMAGGVPEQRCSEHELRRAIAGEELVLHYQPIVDAVSQRLIGVEALVRWSHPQRGLVAPLDFIPLAEESGLIVPLGDWVLRQACRDAARLPSHVKVAVNLSAAQFRSPGLPARVAGVLAASNLLPGRLELEITESRLLDDSDEMLAVLGGLKQLGVRLVLDDFGSGYSCLAHVGRLPLDKLKFDRAFMRDVDTPGRYAAIIRSVASLCAELGVSTTAEGIETAAQRDFARHLGCLELQGYLFGKPRAITDLLHGLSLDPAQAAA